MKADNTKVAQNRNMAERNSDPNYDPNLAVHRIEIAKLMSNNHQPRTIFDDSSINELARSIEWHGLLQPISIQPEINSDKFVIIAGERRVRAYRKLGFSHIDAVIVEGNSAELSLVENLQREDLHPLDLAEGLANLQKLFHYDDQNLAEVIGKSRPTVNELLRINTLPNNIKAECRTSDSVSKSALLQVARGNSVAEKQRLWKLVRASDSVRGIKSKRKRKVADKSRDVDFYESLIAAGQNFHRKFDQMPNGWRLTKDSHYHDFMLLRDKLNLAIDAYKKFNEEDM